MWKSIEETKKNSVLLLSIVDHDEFPRREKRDQRERRENRRVAMVTERTERTD